MVAAGIVRLVELGETTKDNVSNRDYTCKTSLSALEQPLSDPNRADSRAPAIYWTAVEACIGVVSACLPTLRPIFNKKTTHSPIRSFQD